MKCNWSACNSCRWWLLTMWLQVNGDIPPRLKKSAHEIILEFIRSRPPLNPVSSTHVALWSPWWSQSGAHFAWLSRQVSARKLKPHPPRPRSLHERLLEDIKAERKLRPVSPDMIRRSRLGKPTTVGATDTLTFIRWHASTKSAQLVPR